MMEAMEDIWQIEGEDEVDSNIGICSARVSEPLKRKRYDEAHKCNS